LAAVSIGSRLQKRQSVPRVAGATIAGSLVFFMLTNFGFWLTSGIYPMTADGLLTCYWKAIPFYRMALLGDLFYAAVLFGGFAFATCVVPQLRDPSSAIVAQQKVSYN
ncbi:MAG: hypothetical protein MI757_17490, partial [Pirellulales bacterium]|nr:hypothetical protein [Pirellulales bacterium]